MENSKNQVILFYRFCGSGIACLRAFVIIVKKEDFLDEQKKSDRYSDALFWKTGSTAYGIMVSFL